MSTPNVENNRAVNSNTNSQPAVAGSDPYAHPEKFCDLVMKGGITSGVVYTLAVCELAKTYSFKNIGGASAGAIAAAVTAAAEYGRRTGAKQSKAGFAGLEKVPDFLAGNLSSLFQANRPTRPLYNIVLKAIGVKGGVFKR